MGLFTVDPTKCLRDGICVAECPRFLIAIQDEGSCPEPVEGADELCLACGHCMAVCPVGALTLKGIAPEERPQVRPELLPSVEQAEHFLRSRRSVRTFADKPVPREVLERLLDTACYAPSASNSQPVEWLVIYDPPVARRLAQMAGEWMLQQGMLAAYARSYATATTEGHDAICRGAPHLVLAHTPQGREANGVIALTTLELAAYALRLGACWSGLFHAALNGSAELREAVGLPDGRACSGVMLLGYPRYAYQRLPQRKPARIVWR